MKQRFYTFAIVSIVVAVLSAFGYCFVVGVVEAGCAPKWIPTSVLQAYCEPAQAIERLPLVGIFLRIGDDFGYQLTDGPETTR